MRAKALSIQLSVLVSAAALFAPGVATASARSPQVARVIHAFSGPDGDEPTFVIQARDGTLYGVGFIGGEEGVGSGTLYKVDRSGSFTLLHVFGDTPDGSIPGRLIQASDGSIYGVTATGGSNSAGTIYRFDPVRGYRVIHSFNGLAEGSGPDFLIEAAPGTFYGTAAIDGTPSVCTNHEPQGTAFRMDARGKVTPLHTFCENVDGQGPNSIVPAGDGLFYGTTFEDGPLQGGGLGLGTFWRMDGAGNVTVLHTFEPTHLNGDESNEPKGIVLAPDGNFYGAADGGASSIGALFRAEPSGNVETIHSFGDFPAIGSNPGPISLGRDGLLYGTAREGGPDLDGTVYRADLQGNVTLLHAFSGRDGMNPAVAPFLGRGGLVYATTLFAGPEGSGTLVAVKT